MGAGNRRPPTILKGADMGTIVRLGNPAPMMTEVLDGGVTRQFPAPHMSQSVTTVEMRPGFDDKDAVELALTTRNDRMLSMIGDSIADSGHAVGVAEIEHVMSVHAGGSRPAWVDCPEDPEFAASLAQHFGCPVGEPIALLVNAGRDALHAQHMSTSAQPASFNYMAVSANVTTESSASTTLPGEITTAGGGLLRAQATYAHTAGTNTTTLTRTFTANGSDALPVVLAKIGVLNAAAVGTLGYEKLLNATATLTVSGDSVTITETVTAG